jgi:hypothetical protein
MLLYVYAAVIVLCFVTFRSWRVVAVVPLQRLGPWSIQRRTVPATEIAGAALSNGPMCFSSVAQSIRSSS